MILIDAHCSIVPARHQDFIREVRKIVPAVHREAGCSRYELFADVALPGSFHFIEEWESRTHLDEHLAQPHMKEYFALTDPWHSVPTRLKIYEVVSSQSITMDT
jgi:quinol monooxygenase YgiN